MAESSAVSLALSIVIVNHNTRQLLLDLLQSIVDSPINFPYECIVVDNASSDNSVAAVREHFPQVRIIANTNGRYYSGGNNQGIEAAHGRYILILSPDMLVLGDTLNQLVAQMDAHPEIGAATTVMYFPDKRLQINCCREVSFPYLIFEYTFWGKLFPQRLQAFRDWLWYADWDRQSNHEVGVMPGSCIIAPASIWKAVGGFEARLPMYFSDNYFTRAVAQSGKKTVYLLSDGVMHYEGASTQEKTKRTLTTRYLRMYFANLLTYIRLVFGRPAQLAFACLLVPTLIIQFWRAR
jgi:GT2 family glycosyltransferase